MKIFVFNDDIDLASPFWDVYVYTSKTSRADDLGKSEADRRVVFYGDVVGVDRVA